MPLALIGPGRHGRRYLEERNGGRHVLAVCGRADSLDDAIRNVDGVIIATPPDTHRELVLRCLAAGKAVLCEKPLALTLDDCEAMLDAAERAGLPLVVAHQHLWADGFARHLGKPVTRIGSVSGGPDGHDYSPWLDWGSHDVAMAVAAFGEAPLSCARASLLASHRALLTFRGGHADILTGILPARVRMFDAGTWTYDGTFAADRAPMRLMVEAFARGERDWRSSIAFGRAVSRALFAAGPAAP